MVSTPDNQPKIEAINTLRVDFNKLLEHQSLHNNFPASPEVPGPSTTLNQPDQPFVNPLTTDLRANKSIQLIRDFSHLVRTKQIPRSRNVSLSLWNISQNLPSENSVVLVQVSCQLNCPNLNLQPLLQPESKPLQSWQNRQP